MSRISIFLSLVLALLLAGASNVKSEVTFGKVQQGTDGRNYRQATFQFDLKESMSNKSELLDSDFRSKVGVLTDGKVTVTGFNPAETSMYLAGQLSNKANDDPDIGLSWQKPYWIKMNQLENGIYEATVLLLDGATYDYKFVAWDKKGSYPAFTKDPNNPVVSDAKYGNSRITVTGAK